MFQLIVAAAAGYGVDFLIGKTKQIVSGSVDIQLEPVRVVEQRIAWSANPIMLPDPATLIELQQTDRLRWDEFLIAMQAHGIDFRYDTYYGNLWRKVLELRRNRPSTADLIESMIKGTIDKNNIEKELLRLGMDMREWDFVFFANQSHLLPDAALAALKRGLISEENFRWILRRNKILDESQIKIMQEMGNIVPGVSDLISFVVREAFNEDAVKNLGLDAEYEDNQDFSFWAGTQGLGKARAKTESGEWKEIDFAKMYWRSHWQLPSPGQAFQFLHRLREDRINYYRSILPPKTAEKLEPFTATDLDSLLKAADFAPKWRPMMAAISYSPYRLVDLRRLYFTGFINKNDVITELQDLGYSRDYAGVMADWYEFENDKDEITSQRELSKSEVLKAYEIGTISKQEAILFLYPLVQKNISKMREFDAANDAERLSIASQYPGVKNALLKVDLSLLNREASEVIRVMKSKVLNGLISLDEMGTELMFSGIEKERAESYIRFVARLLDSPRKQINVGKMQQLFLMDVISLDEVETRLQNFGYKKRDVEMMLREMRIKKRMQDEKSRKAREREEAAEESKKSKGQKQQSKMEGGKAPLSELKKWYSMDLITEQELRHVLSLREWTAWEIEKWMQSLAVNQP